MLAVEYYREKHGLRDISISGFLPFSSAQCMAVRNDWPILAAILQKALDTITPEEHAAIYRNAMQTYFPQKRESLVREEILIAVLLVLLGIFLWNRKLRREVRQSIELEKALAKSERNLRTMFDHNVSANLIVDPKTFEILDCNRAAEQFYGYSREQLLKMTGRDLSLSLHSFPQNTDRIYHFEEQHKTATGKLLDVEVYGRYTNQSNRKVFFTAIHDITESKRFARESNQWISALSQAYEAIIIIDFFGKIEFANAAAERMSGYSSAELLKMNIDFQRESFNATVHESIWKTIRSGNSWKGIYSWKNKNGSMNTTQCIVTPVRNQVNEIINYIVLYRDISEHMRLTEQLEFSQKLEVVGRLAGGVAHDFNNMLQIILGNVEIILDQIPSTHAIVNDLHAIKSATIHCAELTKELLAFARKQPILPKVINLNDAIVQILSIMRRMLGESIQLTWMPQSGVKNVFMDPVQIKQILVNLCSHARDSIDAIGTVSITIMDVNIDETFRQCHPESRIGAFVRLTVADTGPSLTAEEIKHIFEPFFTTKKIGAATGGLGLATVYGIVRQNKGFITVTSEAGVGNAFNIYLPAVA